MRARIIGLVVIVAAMLVGSLLWSYLSSESGAAKDTMAMIILSAKAFHMSY